MTGPSLSVFAIFNLSTGMGMGFRFQKQAEAIEGKSVSRLLSFISCQECRLSLKNNYFYHVKIFSKVGGWDEEGG